MSKNKVIVSGITGFVGTNLKEYLKRNKYIVIGVSRKKSNFKDMLMYLNTLETLNTTKAFIHLAGKAHDLKKSSEDKEYFEVNTELTKGLFDKFLQSTCETFIYMSSVKAVADEVEGILMEDVTPNPITPYGKSKLAAEKYILSQELPPDKRVYILRPCMIHGVGNKGNLNLLYTFVGKGIPYPFGNYENKRSFVSIENLCFVIKELIKNNKIKSGIYNVADDDPISTNELVAIIGNTIEKQVRILKIPKLIIKIVSKMGDIIPMPINSERLQKMTENYVVSNKKIKKAIHKELPLSSEKGIEKTIKSFL